MTHSLIVLGGATCVAGVAVVLRHWGSRQPASSDPAPDRTTGERFPRSRLLERATIGIGGLIALGIAVPTVGLAALPSFLRRRDPAIDLGPTTSFPVDEFIVVTFLSDAEAGEVSRRAAYVRNNGSLGEPSELHDHVEPLHARRMPDAAKRANLRNPAAICTHSQRRGRPCPHPAGRVRLPVPRQPVRHGGEPDCGTGASRPRQVRVLDSRRPPVARAPLQRQPRPGNRRGSADPWLRAARSRSAANGCRVMVLPHRPTVVSHTDNRDANQRVNCGVPREGLSISGSSQHPFQEYAREYRQVSAGR